MTPLTGEQIRVRGLAALRKELGRAGLARFLRHYEPGVGDYTRDRAEYLKDLTMHEIRQHIGSQKPLRKKPKNGRSN